jgi:parvulin-like peptidyl-prolyl isomerase
MAAAAAGVFGPSALDDRALPEGVAARVNGEPIYRSELDAALEMLARDKRNPLEDGDRAHVLDRLIEEELLVQRGLAIGLVESDRTVRKNIVTAMIDSVVMESRSETATDDELRSFYEGNRDYFLRPDALRVHQILFREGSDRGDPSARAKEAFAAIGEGMSTVDASRRYGDAPVHPVPDVPLPPTALREYLGPTAAAIQSLEPGEISPPLPSPYGRQIIELVERRRNAAPPFEEIRDQIVAAYRQRQAGEALREYLDLLRDEAYVELDPGAPR